jgi:uncharacterized membrane protein
MIVLVLCGSILLSYGPGTFKKIQRTTKKTWILWALLGAFSTGLGDFLTKTSFSAIDINTFIFLFAFGFLISVCFFWVVDKKGRKLPKKITFSTLKWTLLGTSTLSIGVFSITYAFSLGKASLVSIVSSGYIGLTVLLAYLFLHEKVTKLQLIGILCMIIGITFVGV